ncbi:uncharacterized protein F4807DRAFT_68385 [Annulohypoxylon truncatum]|uniref:uncharacterized protein n=1 Tax=Annulohypoxylon truncatum TaxID=327061 RepID=UPI002008E885|nr:uncharacterized protein F4807DRAFT_68385 [Annulohypoxylon truncatum]KAI1210492.1 hypothetical protein F4807DRAFT_68385 [Annulohypoxylon truncatum]
MDPFTAIGLAGNIISFLDFGYKLISIAKGIHASASGSSAYNDNLSHSTQQLQQLVNNLKVANPLGSFSEQERSLLRVASDCESVSVELANLLDKLKAPNSKSMRGAFRAAIRNWRKKDEKAELELQLDSCRQQLSLELVSLSRSESLERLNKLLAHGQANEFELRSLIKNVESLRLGINVSCLGSEALDQIRSLLRLTDDAILDVRQTRILDALRFEHMNERLEDIEEAHRKTFSWIFAGEADTAGEYIMPDGVSMRPPENDLSDSSSFERGLYDLPLSECDSDSLMSDGGSAHSEITRQQRRRRQRETSSAFSDIGVPNSARENLSEARDSFIGWLQRDSGIFYISGKPGSGKSTLMKYITQHPRTKDYLSAWAGDKKLVLGAFFFWKPGSALQRSIKGLIRGLLYCLLSECHDLIPIVFPTQWESSANRENFHIEHHECQRAFERLITASRRGGEHKISLFVDGLDEFEGNHAALIRQLLAWSNENSNVKICVSSREWAIFRDNFGDFPKFRLHDLTSSDIRLFVRDRFREMRISTLLNNDSSWVAPGIFGIEDFEKTIVDESDGVFLWVSIVLRHVEDGLANGDQLKDLVRLIKSLPTDLEPRGPLRYASLQQILTMTTILVFQQLLESIPHNNRRLAYSMLSLAHFCHLHLHNTPLMQFSFLEEYIEDRNFALYSGVSLLTTKERDERLARSKRRIYGLCKGLLELRPSDARCKLSKVFRSVVRLIHRSISEFLESQDFKQKMDTELPDFDPLDAYCHTYLGLLQRVRLPASYYASKTRPKYPMPYNFYDGPYSNEGVFYNPLYLSLRHELETMILGHIVSGQRASSRFHKLLDAAHKTLSNLERNFPNNRCTLVVRDSDLAVHCDPKDLVVIACAQMGFYEYLILKQNISCELMSCCASVALLSFGFVNYHGPEMWNTTLKFLGVLFDHGASPDSSIISGRESAFHMMLQNWCYCRKLNLAAVAFMLYHGINPRFALVMGRTKYTYSHNNKCPAFFKVYFTSEQFSPDPEHGMQTMRILRRRERRYVIEETPTILRTIKKYGQVVDLRTLVSFWFPDQSAVLQEVIDWILALGCPVEARHRAELQDRFGPALRPFFDLNHPNFVQYSPEDTGLQLLTRPNSLFGRHTVFLFPRAIISGLRRCVEEPGATGDEIGMSSTTHLVGSLTERRLR